MTRILAVDIDECCLDVWPIWLKWCNVFDGCNEDEQSVEYNYDLKKVFGDWAMDFWATPNLYQKLSPKKDCVEVLKKLHDVGWEIGFVTYAKKGHYESKCEWIKHHFPFYSFINASKEKGYTYCTHAIDDRCKHLNQYPDNVKLIRMLTMYTQEESCNRITAQFWTWNEIYELLKGET